MTRTAARASMDAMRRLRDRGGERAFKGNLVGHEYKIEVAPGQDDALILTIAVCIDRMGHD